MIGIVVPAHNEEAYLAACIKSLRNASRHCGLGGEDVRIVVVLDACTDRSLAVARRLRVMTLSIEARNVGRARACGAKHLIGAGARWLAFTDADTIVSPEWLSQQLGLQADAVCGCVSVNDWSPHPADVRALYDAAYRNADDHRHVHGANFGVSTDAYQAAGGFPPLALGEDVALVEALTRNGCRIAWSSRPRVTTSARREGRARGGFADHLMSLRLAASPSVAAP